MKAEQIAKDILRSIREGQNTKAVLDLPPECVAAAYKCGLHTARKALKIAAGGDR